MIRGHERRMLKRAVQMFVDITGEPAWRAWAVIEWRRKRGLSVFPARILEPDGRVTHIAP